MSNNFIEKVTVTLDNTKPVEVLDFLTSVQGFYSQYRKVVKDSGIDYNNQSVKLYINTVKGGVCLYRVK